MVKFRNTKRRLKKLTKKVLLPILSSIGQGYCIYLVFTAISRLDYIEIAYKK